ncbi:uncharacterized protein LOC107877777 isoform X2 [Capsicum annuum]|uniref:uncharacterized protein LOC107877777 isoform X2 n=1 Tax=Capsicum annuum TaxID=4072 RepID=UPI001FB07896|nr:uncharacterized protein LOC107877777 isoform X2 [Capsicum annuum]
MVSGDNRSHHHPADFLLIKQDDKFFSRLLSKESTGKGESSFRYYYCGGSSGSIPFVWESQPGTPKHKFSDTSLPPLTPPPSYQTNAHLKSLQKQSKSNFFLSIFPKISSKRITFSPSVLTSSSVSSSCSSSFSMSSVQNSCNNSNPRNYRSRSEIEEYDHEKLQIPSSPTSTLCFGCGMGNSKCFRVNYPVKKNVKKKVCDWFQQRKSC